MIELIYLLVGLALGVGIALILLKSSKSKLEAEKDYLQTNLGSQQSELKELREAISQSKADYSGLVAEKKALQESYAAQQEVLQQKADLLQQYEERREAAQQKQNELELQISNLLLKLQNADNQQEELAGRLAEQAKKSEQFLAGWEAAKKEISEQKISLAEKDNTNQALTEKLQTQKEEITTIQERFSESFKNLANEILDDKSSRFTKLNQQNLDAILSPLQEKIKEFQSTVRETNEKNLLSNRGLIEQISHLKEMNQQISEEANNLTKALKGDVKTQGNWGEVILERLLEESGLRKGAEYETQNSYTTDNGKRYQPDVIIHLPDAKDIIVDAKVSLVHYEKFAAAETEEQRLRQVKLLTASVKGHIDGLHKKHYHELKELNTPDFVLLFMPIEGSFATVMQYDNQLYKHALEKHIVVVSPSTLLATLRTIAFIWRQENQTKNALEIARQSGALYDKFEGFLSDLEKIGTNVDRAKEAYDKAVNKLKTGRGNLVGRAEKLKKLGAKASKSIAEKFLPNEADEDDDDLEKLEAEPEA
ncbi:MAG: DNA recombination protein RmuC [Candidatus Cloacimonadales bacterium]